MSNKNTQKYVVVLHLLVIKALFLLAMFLLFGAFGLSGLTWYNYLVRYNCLTIWNITTSYPSKLINLTIGTLLCITKRHMITDVWGQPRLWRPLVITCSDCHEGTGSPDSYSTRDQGLYQTYCLRELHHITWLCSKDSRKREISRRMSKELH